MKRILILFILLVNLQGYAQEQKMNLALAKKIAQGSGELIDVFVKGRIETIRLISESTGGKMKYYSGDIAAIRIPASALPLLASQKDICRIEAYPAHVRPMNDTMLLNNNVVAVHNGQAPLPQAYNGSGVIMGIIDTGIDFSHPDFRDSLGNTRIKYIWDQTLPVGATTPSYGYGIEFDSAMIDGGMATAHTDIPWNGHGTHVSGIAAGNGLSSGTYKGVAFKSDIIVVAFDFSSTDPTVMTDAVDYIYTKASAMGKPCVINASLGDYYGSHDGLDLQAQMIKNQISAQNGRSFVAASGNAGDVAYHLGYTVTTDTNFTFFYNGGQLYLQMWADTNDLKNVDFSIGADNLAPYSFRGNIPFSNISTHLAGLDADTLYNGSNRIGIVETFGSLNGGVYSMEFLISPDSTSYNWRLMCTGSGKFDLWSFDVVNSGLPVASLMPDSIYYEMPDLNMTLVSSFQCLDEVITVGNYTNRKSMLDYNSTLYVDNTRIPGKRHPNSSCGPTRDGRTKPDLAAPGDFTVSCSLLSNLPADAIAYPTYYDPGGYHIRGGGTSAASPGVAGIAALYLQMNPTASAAQIKNALTMCTTIDGFTGAVPNNEYGYGKANAFGAMTGCMITDINEEHETPFSIYPNPANAGTQITVDVNLIGCRLFVYNMTGQLVLSKNIESQRLDIGKPETGIYLFQMLREGRIVAAEKMIILRE